MEIEPIAPKIQEKLDRKRVQIAVVQQRQEALIIALNTPPKEPDLTETPFEEQDEIMSKYLDAMDVFESDEFKARRARILPLLEQAQITVANRLRSVEEIKLESFTRNEQKIIESPEKYGVNAYQQGVSGLKRQLKLKAKIDLDRMEEIERERDQKTQVTIVPVVKQDIDVEVPQIEEPAEVTAALVEEVVQPIVPVIEEEVEQVKPVQVIENVGVSTKEDVDKIISNGANEGEIEPFQLEKCFTLPYPTSVQTNGSLQPEQPREKTMDEKIADGEPIWEEKDGVVLVQKYTLSLKGNEPALEIARRLPFLSQSELDRYLTGKMHQQIYIELGAYRARDLADIIWGRDKEVEKANSELKKIKQNCKLQYSREGLRLDHIAIPGMRNASAWFFTEIISPQVDQPIEEAPVVESVVVSPVEPVKKKTKKQTRV